MQRGAKRALVRWRLRVSNPGGGLLSMVAPHENNSQKGKLIEQDVANASTIP